VVVLQERHIVGGQKRHGRVYRETQGRVAGVLSGFDRLVFRGTLRSISYPEGMMGYRWANQVRLTEFGRHVQRVSERLKQACRAKAEALRRPMKYLASAGESDWCTTG
jgi:hypothetical protein